MSGSSQSQPILSSNGHPDAEQSAAEAIQREFDYAAMTVIAAHLLDNPAAPYSGRQCSEFVQDARDRLYGEPGRLCGWCGEAVTGPCHHPNDPRGLYGAPIGSERSDEDGQLRDEPNV